MKNVLILGLVALLLFSVSATLSVWLNQPKPQDEPAAAKAAPRKPARKDPEAAAAAAPAEGEKDAPAARPVFRPKANPATEEAGQLAAQLREQQAAVKDRETRLDRRQSQIDLVLQDIRAERLTVDKVRKQVAEELRLLVEKIAELEQKQAAKAPEPVKKPAEVDEAAERKNLDRMAVMYETMPAENAARILQQMADMGKLDTAVRLLSQMKERQAAKVLSEISDPALAAQMLEKMRGVKRSPPVSAPQP
jgi:flagellar motility protein MotE (MotC chaperone)